MKISSTVMTVVISGHVIVIAVHDDRHEGSCHGHAGHDSRHDPRSPLFDEGNNLAPALPPWTEAMHQTNPLKVLFVAGFGPVVDDTTSARNFYGDILGIPFKEESDGYLHTESLQGAKSFALWPLSQAAQSCFGTDSWPDDIRVPQAWLEFDVENVEEATAWLEAQRLRMLVRNRKEPWGQTVSRFLDPEGLLIGITFTPLLREAAERNP